MQSIEPPMCDDRADIRNGLFQETGHSLVFACAFGYQG
jgi:hypothetical protein